MNLGMAEILRKASELPTREEKVKYLQKNYSPALGLVLQAALDPAIKWDLPDGKPPYKPLASNTDQQYMLYQQAKKLNKFFVGNTFEKTKRELMFVQLLESCDPEDAELLINAKDKKLLFKGITVGLINKAFPGLINT